MNIYSLPDIIGFVFNFAYIVKIYLSPKKQSIHRWLLFTIAVLSLWNLSNLAVLNMSNESTALFFAQINVRILFLLPAFILSFSVIHLQFSRVTKNIILSIVFFVPILLLAATFPDFSLKTVYLAKQNQFYFQLSGRLNPFMLIIFSIDLVYIVLAIILMYFTTKRTISHRYRIFLKILIYGLSILFFIFMLSNINFFSRYSTFYFFKTLFILSDIIFFNLIINFLWSDHKTKSFSNAVNYFFSTILLAIYVLLIKLTIDFIDNLFKIHSFLFDAGLVFLLVLFFQPLDSIINRTISKNLKEKIFSFRYSFLELSKELMEILPDNQLLEKIKEFLHKNFKTSNIQYFKYNESTRTFENLEQDFSISQNSKFIEFLSNKSDLIHIFELTAETICENLANFLEKEKIQIILPIKRKNRLFYIIMLGPKTNQQPYTNDDIDNLQIFSNEISVFLHRNYLYKKIQGEEQKKLQLEKLAALGQLTAGVAHEIRNPLNTISMAAQTLKSHFDQPQIRDKMIQYIEDEIQRLNNLINDFLKLYKIGSVNYNLIDLPKILEQLKIFLEQLNNQITYLIENKVNNTQIYSDSKLIYQILTNLTKNAVEAINQAVALGQLTYDKAFVKIKAFNDAKYLTFEISNNGPMIPYNIRQKIFEPFFTTKENGTGLGLSLVMNIVKTLGGELHLTSNPNLTTFIVKIPI